MAKRKGSSLVLWVGGAISFRALDEQLDLTARLIARLGPWRQAEKIERNLLPRVRQRCFGWPCG